MTRFAGRLGLQQRVLPAYRAPFFDLLAEACEGGMSVFAGEPRAGEAIRTTQELGRAEFFPAKNQHMLRGAFYLCRQTNFLEWLQYWDPDALIVEANARYLSTPHAVRWMRQRGRPVVGWGLGAPPLDGPFAGIRERRRIKLLRSLDAVVAYSSRGADQYRALALPPEHVFTAPNAVAPPPVGPPPHRPEGFKGAPVVLFVGRLQQRKRVDDLLHACAQMPHGREPRLLIVGDGPEREALEALAAQIYPQAEFTGSQHGMALQAYFQQADLFVLPGTGGLAIQEAMAAGLPVMVAEGDGTQNDLVRPANGWLLPPGDREALTRSLSEALSDAARLRKMGLESYRIAKQEINIEAMAAVFLDVLVGLR
jgi:glycosyltransferase involved in cell wall biosynthesis